MAYKCGIAALGTIGVLTVTAVQAADDVAVVKEAVTRVLPGVSIDALNPSPVPGLYEVTTGNRLLYVTADGRYMLAGDLIDLVSRTNLSQERRGSLIGRSLDAIGEGNMIVFAPKQVKRTITVFTDVDCPYCARLHQEVPELLRNGVKVRYLLFPRQGEGSETYKRAVAVWCAPDRQKALGAAKGGGKIELRSCDNPVARHVALGHSVGVDGTPTIVTDAGQVVPGYAPAAELLRMLGLGMTPSAGP